MGNQLFIHSMNCALIGQLLFKGKLCQIMSFSGRGNQQQEIRSPPIISQQQSAQIRLAQQFISVPHPPI